MKIAILPTGDWSVIREWEPVRFFEIDDSDYEEFQNSDGQDTTLCKCIGEYSLEGFQEEQPCQH
jgi:hypothetical protein